ncbi:MAG: zinc ribbon domain-containing protein [Thermoplasmata archaeon]
MPSKGLLGRLRRKTSEHPGAEDRAQPPKHNERSDQSMQYIYSPSALEYPGVKKKESPPAREESKEIPEAKGKTKPEGELPRCPACGWAIGFEDTVCMNCGQKLR